MDLLLILLVVLALTRLGGEVAERLRQPALVGEVGAGIVLGLLAGELAAVAPALVHLNDDGGFAGIVELGMFFLMLLAGMELEPHELAEASAGALLVATGGFLLPLGLGFGFAWLVLPESGLKLAQALCVGVALAITAVPVAVRALQDLGQLHSRAGRLIVSAALFDDVFSLLLLSLLGGLIATGHLPNVGEVARLVANVVVFFVIALACGWYVFPRLAPLVQSARIADFPYSAVLIAGLACAGLAELLSLHVVVGAFLAGLFAVRLLGDTDAFADAKAKIQAGTRGFLAPVFFASIGLQIDLAALQAVPGFVVALTAVAMLGKLVGAGLPARWLGLSRRGALVVGLGMSARGAVELIVVGIALDAGVFAVPVPPPPIVANLFSALVLVALVTTLAMPVTLRLCLRGEPLPRNYNAGP